jgi:pimeloyl-ACP methyl ester carboxylesterase
MPDDRVNFYARAPRLLLPVFGIAAWRRARGELRAALPAWGDRIRFTAGQGARVVLAPVSPQRMVQRIELLSTIDFHQDAARVKAPTLIVTGDEELDLTVPVRHTREYLDLLPAAEYATLERTGHLGTVTRPDAFARIVHGFVERSAASRDASGQRVAR